MIKYSIIICTYNRAPSLRETIASVLEVSSNRIDHEIIVIDNNSTDDTSFVVKSFDEKVPLKYFLETQQGLSHARNRGLTEAKGKILVFLDDDIDLDKNYFQCCDRLFENTNINIIGGKVLPYRVSIPQWLPQKYYYLASVFDLGDNELQVDKVMGANYAMRESVAVKVGEYNPLLGRKGNSLMGGEEVDYLNRAIENGFTILYSPDLVVYHKINDKLNHTYIYNYALKLGQSESIIDRKNNAVKTLSKSIKSVIAICSFSVLKFFLKNPKHLTYFKIVQQYGYGYLKKSKSC